MEWHNYVIPVLFICLFIYGYVKQVQQSVLLHKTVSPNHPFNKRLVLGNHLYSFSFGGFVSLLILNGFFYLGMLPQTQQIGNTISLVSILFLLSMFISKFVIIPKDQFQYLPPLFKRR
jgi:nitrate/nitrite transporter NarK